MKNKNTRKRILATVIISIILFLFAFYLYVPLYLKVGNYIGSIDITTNNIGSRFIYNIFFALNVGMSPILSLIILNRVKTVKLRLLIVLPVILLLFEMLGVIIRLMHVRSVLTNINSKSSISFETIKIEESMFFSAIIGGCFIYMYLRKRISKV